MGLLNVGARALLANQVALQTAGHNISNVNTAGYSRQTVVLQTVQGQFTGGGYIGKGVDVQTIKRNQNELLTRQSATAEAVQSADTVRADRMRQIQDIFGGGTGGLGAGINDMMNALSDVVSAPTDLTARSVALTRMDETALRMRAAAGRLGEIQSNVSSELDNGVTQINRLAPQIAALNEQIANAQGNGQPANDLLDKRDQLIRDLNQYIQTTQIEASDGSMGIFVASSQPLVLGNTASKISVEDRQSFGGGSGNKALYFTQAGSGTQVELNDSMLGGGLVSGLVRFQNGELTEGTNLLGRLAMSIGMTLNAQQQNGLTLEGVRGSALFSVPTTVTSYNVPLNSGSAPVVNATYVNPAAFAASDYEVQLDGSGGGQVVRLADGKTTFVTDFTDPAQNTLDGLQFSITGGVAGDRILFKPFANTAANIEARVVSPRELAAANAINAAMGSANAGSLKLASLQASSAPGSTLTLPAPGAPVTLGFDSGPPATYSVTGSTTPASGTTGLPYTSGQKITVDGWEITLQGNPSTGDTVTVGNASDPVYGDWYQRDAGNASAMMALRDTPLFDGATLSDGYASLMAQVGTRTQSAQFALDLSSNIAASLERDRAAVSGVNLDEEAAKLIQYQQAYQASAKMIQIAQNIFDTLIQGLGR